MSSRQQRIERFFRYARARHTVYLNRAAGMEREKWTRDPILMKYRFTNVFRELDRTTVWFREYVRDPMRNNPSVLLATVVFRLLNRIEVGEAIFSQSDMFDMNAFNEFCHGGNVRVLKKAILAGCGDGPYVTGAYIISSPQGYSKLDGVLEVIRRFYHDRTGWWRDASISMLNGNPPWSLENAWNNLKEFDYFGPFHAYEIVTDLRHTALLDRAPDIMTWANPGPGAHRGANRIFRDDRRAKVPRSQVIDEMRLLLSWSRDAKLWPQEMSTVNYIEGGVRKSREMQIYSNWPAWEMRDVEHTLCEFDKYERVRLGEGKPRGVYR